MDYQVAIYFILFGLSQSYVISCLLLVEKESHEGPFKSRRLWVKFPSGHTQKVSLFDRIRRLFGVYRVVNRGMIWEVDPDRSERWTCPFCLSFWISFVFAIPLIAILELSPWLYPIFHLSLSYFSVLLVGVRDAL